MTDRSTNQQQQQQPMEQVQNEINQNSAARDNYMKQISCERCCSQRAIARWSKSYGTVNTSESETG